MLPADSDTEALIECAKRGDESAFEQLLVRHRDRLRHMVSMRFAEQLKARDEGPLKRMLRQELHARVRAALAALNDRDREILVLRHLEQLSSQESAVVLGIREDAAVQRHVRAPAAIPASRD